MKTTRLFCGLLVLFCAGCPTVKRLGHFKVYEVSPRSEKQEFRLWTQFDLEAKPASIGTLARFAVPVKKVHPGFTDTTFNKNDHLIWYKLQPQGEPKRTVRFTNQFGPAQSIDIGPALYLLTPVQRLGFATGFPKYLDHYKCYQVVKINFVHPPPVVGLSDLFGSVANVQVGKPIFFCAPVRKDIGGQQGRIRNQKDHIVVYTIPPWPVSRNVQARDQFGLHKFKVQRGVALCVPTQKLAWAAQQ